MDEEILLPLAHAGHWLWLLYLPPVLIVVGSIIRTTLAERRRRKKSAASSASRPGAAATRDISAARKESDRDAR